MKKLILGLLLLSIVSTRQLHAQQNEEITAKNSWLKAGLNAGIPFGKLGDVSNFTLGLDLKGQFMTTTHWGVGVASGYNHFFPKSGYDGFGTIPLGLFARYYPQSEGLFLGTDLGYSFLTGANGADGGFYIRPQIGYHNYNWNFFGFYNGIFRGDNKGGSLQLIGIGAAYNIRFK